MRRHSTDARKQIPHQRTAADHSFEARRFQQLAVQLQRALSLANIGQQLFHTAAQRGDRDGLVQVIAGAFLDGFDGSFGGVVRRHQDYVNGRIELHNAFQNFQAAQLRHHQIQQHDLRMLLKNQVQTFFRVCGREDGKAFLLQGLAQELKARWRVIDRHQLNRRKHNGLGYHHVSRR